MSSLPDFGCRCFGLSTALLIFTGCGGSQVAGPGVMPTSGMATPDVKQNKSGGLLYATGGCGGVCIITYPEGKLKGRISLTSPVDGDCSDNQGNVFVTNNTQVLKFAHGGSKPIATLALPGVNAVACGVDPKTGNLAVVFGGGSAGNIAIFANASGSPTLYNAGTGPYYCGYDNKGNLFASGSTNGQRMLTELPYGHAVFTPLTVEGDVGGPGQLQWDGNYITLENQVREVTISRLSIAGSIATVVGKTRLRSPRFAAQSWIAGKRVIVPYSTQGNVTYKISLWRYPESGKAVVKFGNFGQSKQTRFLGVVLSI
jgi:hypothetical protein